MCLCVSMSVCVCMRVRASHRMLQFALAFAVTARFWNALFACTRSLAPLSPTSTPSYTITSTSATDAIMLATADVFVVVVLNNGYACAALIFVSAGSCGCAAFLSHLCVISCREVGAWWVVACWLLWLLRELSFS